MPKLAILGRPNVGKSTLYNRLAGRREAIVHDQPGVTRDRKYGKGSIGSLDVEMIDTPGLEDLGKPSLAGRMSAQSLASLKEADIILFVIDARSGVTAEDEAFARHLRKVGLPVIVVANKAENRKIAEATLLECHRLGFSHIVPFSAEHGEGLADLYDAVTACSAIPEEDQEPVSDTDTTEEATRPIHVTIVGRPNVGKSTLVNQLLGEDRVLTGPEAGMTRDAVAVELQWKGKPIHLVDTAGLRKKSSIEESLEQLSVGSTLYALRFADVAILMLDATMPLEKQDNVIAGLIEREGRACVIALNKSDQIKVDEAYLKAFYYRLEDVVPQMKGIQIVPICATEGKGLDSLMKAVIKTYDIWNRRISTSQLNQWLGLITEQHSPPLINGRRLKFRYITQTKSRPPTFVLFSNKSKDVPDSYLRFLVNHLRGEFDLPGVPIRLLLRTGKNPYKDNNK